MKNTNQDQFFSELLRKDQVGGHDKSIEDRLMYSFLLKNSSSKLKQNSFASFLGWIFSSQSLGLKTGLVSAILFFSVMTNQISIESGKVTATDSLFTKRVLVADSTSFIQAIDSIRTDSLN
ncbi:MAG: hypothetical protein Q8S54_00455 [Bacteroidota bacterium]|nr:hypothetical protein [Odoribacter sp.]MDP3641640.1 hypothetical protein [Bacteroidota bacterium]